jgi:hypothetical protein
VYLIAGVGVVDEIDVESAVTVTGTWVTVRVAVTMSLRVEFGSEPPEQVMPPM